MYCLVVTYDYSMFAWIFFLATKDETSGILKSFITRIENLVYHKFKVIRCDNGTEFKIRDMNQFCELKGILRQFSVARTSQQNRVVESRNRTLIEAARTMLVAPTTFWAEAVSTACYVQNIVSTVNTAGTNGVNVVDENISIELQFDSNMHALEDVSTFDFSKDDKDDGAVADMNNLDTTIKVFRNKMNEKRIVIRNKARLVTQGYIQKEGIDYDEVFDPVVRIEAIRLFLAYASCKDFMVYQMDVKSVFLYGKIEEEVYVCQPPGFKDPNFPDRVYKMSSMGELTFFLGLQVKQKKDGTFIGQDKYVAEILKKFGFIEVKTARTPMETQKHLLKDKDGEEVDVYMYRSMIGSRCTLHLQDLTSYLQCVLVLDTKSI
nr:copia protein [Tanacetum cinerariifolium]